MFLPKRLGFIRPFNTTFEAGLAFGPDENQEKPLPPIERSPTAH